jgi:hypothetical protein
MMVPHRLTKILINADWTSRIDDSENVFISRQARSKAHSSIEHRAESLPPTRRTINYPVIRPSTTSDGIKALADSIAKGCTPIYARLKVDPSICLDSIRAPTPSAVTAESEATAHSTRIQKFKSLLQMPIVPLASLKKLAWNGIIEELRPMVWQILLGYLPCEASSRSSTLSSKRKEYHEAVKEAFRDLKGLDQTIWHQIRIDVPRTNPHLSLYQFEASQKALERILYIWAIQHPESGYVQGINDLVTPFFQVFLSAYIGIRMGS